jgi:uncharacterized repeat protein (TIGR01451 family)
MSGSLRSALFAAAIWSLAVSGCASVPRIDPTGERIFTWEPQPAAVVSGPAVAVPAVPAIVAPGLTLTPQRIIAPVGSEVLMVAGVHGPGQPNLPGQRVEWMLSPGSVGHFLAVGESERPRILRLTPPPQKVSNDYAVSETQFTSRIITRGTLDPADDVSVLPGQAWVTVASPVEGSSHVTAFAPDVQGVLANRQSGVIHWVDVRWLAPTSAQVQIGEKHSLVTSVTRASSGAPIAGYIVRYEVSGGVEAGFGPSYSGGVELTTNGEGQASAELGQYVGQPGQTQINVQIIRPAAPPAASEPLVLGSTTIAIDWLALAQPGAPPPIVQGTTPGATTTPGAPATTTPAQTTPPATPPATTAGLEVRVVSPTQEVTAGGEAEFQIEITNRTTTTATNVIVLDRFGSGLVHKVAPTPIRRNVGEIPAGQTKSIGLTFTVREPGRHCHTVEVTADGGLTATAEGCVTAKGVAAEIEETTSIKLTKTGPEKMKVGERALFKIEVTNAGDKPIMGVQVTESWRGGLKAIEATAGNVSPVPNEITWNYNKPLQPGTTVPFEVRYEAVTAEPDSCSRATATAGNDSATDEVCVEITDGDADAAPNAATSPNKLSVIVSDRADPVPVGTQYSYRIVVRNDGALPQSDVVLVVELPASLDLVSIKAPVKAENVKGPTLRFPAVLRLDPKNLVSYELEVTARAAGRVVIRASASSKAITEPAVAEHDTQVFEQTPGAKGGAAAKE